jgi:hypothetical protein
LPEKLVIASLREARMGWMVRDICPVGAPSVHRRQAEQFNGSRQVIGRAGSEIDVMAELLPSRRRG